jgi:hypothetical protein
LGVFTASLIWPYLAPGHASLNDDPRCEIITTHRESTQQIEADRPARSDGHCAVCHSLRAVAGKQTVPAQILTYVPVQFAAASRPSGSGMTAAGLGRQLLRGPPASGSPARPAVSR